MKDYLCLECLTLLVSITRPSPVLEPYVSEFSCLRSYVM